MRMCGVRGEPSPCFFAALQKLSLSRTAGEGGELNVGLGVALSRAGGRGMSGELKAIPTGRGFTLQSVIVTFCNCLGASGFNPLARLRCPA